MNLIEGLQKEMERCRELVKIYEQIPTGSFGAAMIRQDIEHAEKAIADNNMFDMLACYKKLKKCK